MTHKTPEEYLLTANQISAMDEVAISHPLNSKSEVHLRRISDAIGLRRANVKLGRIPPGKESFAYHIHKGDEEWLYILSGRGRAEIGDKNFEVGPGDFMAFPTPSIGHHLRNAGDQDLVYLMGGERDRVDVAEFPKAGKHIIFTEDEILMVDSDKLEPMTFDRWMKKK